MKFLCDQCKAKYQIADEKVQGKTLRMKCRKCGHVIEIRAAESGGSSGDTMQVDSLSEAAAAKALESVRPPPAAAKPAAPAKPAPAAKGAPPRPGSGVTPKPSPAGAPRPAAAPRPSAAGPRPSDAGKDSGALANAFSKAVASPKKPEPTPSAPQHHDTPPEEWYAAIDEVPVGPIRLTDLRQKYAQGAITDDSLVWREGFEEWRPLRTLTELHALVKEEVSGAFNPPGARNSLLPPSGQTQKRAPAPAAGARPAAARPAPTPAPAAPVAARGNVIPFTPARSGAAAARKIEEEFDDEATQIAQPAVILPQPTPAAAASVVDDPFAAKKAAPVVAPIPAPTPAPPSAAPPMGEETGERLTMLDRISVRARGISKGTTVLIAAACVLLGVIIAVVLVKPKVVEKIVEKRVEVPVSVEVPVPTNAGPAPVASAEPSATQKVASKGGTPGAAPKATTTATGGSQALKGLDLGPAGPGLGGPDPGGPPAPGGGTPLSASAVESVVSSKRVGLRKQCFENYSDKGDATVKLQLKINTSGGVDSADIIQSDGPSASLVGPCIQKQARGWRFPASEGGGTFNLPFIFKS